jgi:hypothetical protein
MDGHWFDQAKMHLMRRDVLLAFMPMFFLRTGLRTHWALGGSAAFLAATCC